jgi:acyl carrier protein
MISDKLKQVILHELGLDADVAIDDGTTAGMLPGWDSLNHVRIVAAVENAFAVRFRTREIVKLENVGQLQALVDAKLKTGSR